jgi:hypothetical protein
VRRPPAASKLRASASANEPLDVAGQARHDPPAADEVTAEALASQEALSALLEEGSTPEQLAKAQAWLEADVARNTDKTDEEGRAAASRDPARRVAFMTAGEAQLFVEETLEGVRRAARRDRTYWNDIESEWRITSNLLPAIRRQLGGQHTWNLAALALVIGALVAGQRTRRALKERAEAFGLLGTAHRKLEPIRRGQKKGGRVAGALPRKAYADAHRWFDRNFEGLRKRHKGKKRKTLADLVVKGMSREHAHSGTHARIPTVEAVVAWIKAWEKNHEAS